MEKKDDKKTEKENKKFGPEDLQKTIAAQLTKDRSFVTDIVRTFATGLVEAGLFRQISTIEIEYISDSHSIKSKIQMK